MGEKSMANEGEKITPENVANPHEWSRREFLIFAVKLGASSVVATALPEILSPPNRTEAKEDLTIGAIDVIYWQEDKPPELVKKTAADLNTEYFREVNGNIQQAAALVRQFINDNNISVESSSLDISLQGDKKKDSSLVTPTPSITTSEVTVSPNIVIKNGKNTYSIVNGKVLPSRDEDMKTAIKIYNPDQKKQFADLPKDARVIPQGNKLYLIDSSGVLYAVGTRSAFPEPPNTISWEERKVWDPTKKEYVDRVSSFHLMNDGELKKIKQKIAPVAGIEMEIQGHRWQIVTDVDAYKKMFQDLNPYLFARFIDILGAYLPPSDAYRITLGDLKKHPDYKKRMRENIANPNDYVALMYQDIYSEPGVTKCEGDVDPEYIKNNEDKVFDRGDQGQIDTANPLISGVLLAAALTNNQYEGSIFNLIDGVLEKKFEYVSFLTFFRGAATPA